MARQAVVLIHTILTATKDIFELARPSIEYIKTCYELHCHQLRKDGVTVLFKITS